MENQVAYEFSVRLHNFTENLRLAGIPPANIIYGLLKPTTLSSSECLASDTLVA